MYMHQMCGMSVSNSLFLDIQVVTLLLGEFTLFARANLYYPTTFIFLNSISSTWDVREALLLFQWYIVHSQPCLCGLSTIQDHLGVAL